MDKEDIVYGAAKKLKDIYIAKNHDYGNSFHDTYQRHGYLSAAIRVEDKLHRWKTLMSAEQKVNDESLLDTIGDCATYLCMWAAEYDYRDDYSINDLVCSLLDCCYTECDEDDEEQPQSDDAMKKIAEMRDGINFVLELAYHAQVKPVLTGVLYDLVFQAAALAFRAYVKLLIMKSDKVDETVIS